MSNPSAFQIKTDVPMPGARNSYPFESMPAGASFEIVGEEEARKVRNAAYQYAKKMNHATAVGLMEAQLGKTLTADERKAVEAIQAGADGYVAFALRKLRVIDDKGHVRTDKVTDSKFADGHIAHGVFGLWRTA